MRVQTPACTAVLPTAVLQSVQQLVSRPLSGIGAQLLSFLGWQELSKLQILGLEK
jgi:hypothetical protein